MIMCSACAFASFRFMPVGDVVAIGMLAPIVITLVAVLGFGERLSPVRAACVAGGFIGALVVARPGGWLVLAHAPDLALWLGIALIAVSGAVGTWLAGREERDAPALAVQPPAP